MKREKFCQSCGLPLSKDELLGTEKDGTLNNEFCHYCYQNGSYTNPMVTLAEMQIHVRHMLERQHDDAKHIYQIVNMLPEMKRWYKPMRV